MNWVKTGIFSLVGGFAVGVAAALVLSTAGDCGIGAAAKAIGFGIPIGNILGIGVYRKFLINRFTEAEIAGGILALVLSAFASFAGLHAMDVMGSMPGLFVSVLGSCLGSLLGYAAGLKIVQQYRRR